MGFNPRSAAFFFCVRSYMSGVHHTSSSAFPALSLGFTILLLHSKLHPWNSSYFFISVPSYISEVHHTYSAFPAISLGFAILILRSKLHPWGFIILLHLRSQLHLWGSPYFFFWVPSYISGVHHTSSSAFPAISLGFTILLLLRSQLYLWGSPYFFFCVPSYISGVQHYYSSSAFRTMSLGSPLWLRFLHMWPFFLIQPLR